MYEDTLHNTKSKCKKNKSCTKKIRKTLTQKVLDTDTKHRLNYKIEKLSFSTSYAHGQSLSSFRSSSRQNSSSIWRRHSFSKTVLISFLSLRWLECSFHDFTLIFLRYRLLLISMSLQMYYFFFLVQIFISLLSFKQEIYFSISLSFPSLQLLPCTKVALINYLFIIRTFTLKNTKKNNHLQ